MSAAAVAGLYSSDVIPLWLPVVLIGITILLQASHSTSYAKLKRHTYYLHPLFFLAVVYFAGEVYLIKSQNMSAVGFEAFIGACAMGIYQIAWAVAGYFKLDRLEAWFAGPPQNN